MEHTIVLNYRSVELRRLLISSDTTLEKWGFTQMVKVIVGNEDDIQFCDI